MLSVPAKVRVFLCTRSTDMRKSFNGLHGMVLEVLRQDPQSGDLFVFLNRRRDRVKILLWDGDGLLIVYKRLEAGTFAPPTRREESSTSEEPGESGESITLTPTQLALLLGGIDLKDTRARRRYQHQQHQQRHQRTV